MSNVAKHCYVWKQVQDKFGSVWIQNQESEFWRGACFLFNLSKCWPGLPVHLQLEAGFSDKERVSGTSYLVSTMQLQPPNMDFVSIAINSAVFPTCMVMLGCFENKGWQGLSWGGTILLLSYNVKAGSKSPYLIFCIVCQNREIFHNIVSLWESQDLADNNIHPFPVEGNLHSLEIPCKKNLLRTISTWSNNWK